MRNAPRERAQVPREMHKWIEPATRAALQARDFTPPRPLLANRCVFSFFFRLPSVRPPAERAGGQATLQGPARRPPPFPSY